MKSSVWCHTGNYIWPYATTLAWHVMTDDTVIAYFLNYDKSPFPRSRMYWIYRGSWLVFFLPESLEELLSHFRLRRPPLLWTSHSTWQWIFHLLITFSFRTTLPRFQNTQPSTDRLWMSSAEMLVATLSRQMNAYPAQPNIQRSDM